MNRLLLAFTAPALGTALAVAGLSFSGTVAARTNDRPPIEASKARGQTCEYDDASKDERRPKERGLAKDGRDTLPGPLQLASRLAALESFIGIQADQFAVWRAYTDALQAFIRSPEAIRETPGIKSADALTQSTALAEQAVARAPLAATLSSTAGSLRARLAPEQIERLQQAGPLLPPTSPDIKADARPRGCA